MAKKTNEIKIQGNDFFSSAKRTLDYNFLEKNYNSNYNSDKKEKCSSPYKFQMTNPNFKIFPIKKKVSKQAQTRTRRKMKFSLNFKKLIKNLKKKKVKMSLFSY
jgi:hypothetical protein